MCFQDWVGHFFFSNLGESFLHLDKLQTGNKPYQECQTTNCQAPSCRQYPVQNSTEEPHRGSTFLYTVLSLSCNVWLFLSHNPQRKSMSQSQTLFWAQGRHPGWRSHTLGSDSYTNQPGSPSWPSSTVWPPGTGKHGTMETRWTHSLLSTHTFSSPHL